VLFLPKKGHFFSKKDKEIFDNTVLVLETKNGVILDRIRLAKHAREQRSDKIKTKVFQVAEVLQMQDSLCKKSGNVNISRVAKIANCKRETAKKYLIEGGYIKVI
jgi:hypothetical protein